MNEFKHVLGWDVDGVLGNFRDAYCVANQLLPYADQWDINDPAWENNWKKVKDDPHYWYNLRPMANPSNMKGLNNKCYITAVPPKMKAIREGWLKKNKFPDIPCFVEHQKVPQALLQGLTHFVDDKAENAIALADAGIIVFFMIGYYADYQTHLAMIEGYENIIPITHLGEIRKHINAWEELQTTIKLKNNEKA